MKMPEPSRPPVWRPPPSDKRQLKFAEPHDGAPPCPDPSLPYLWADGQWVLIAGSPAQDDG